jgi:signal transduction histidine kinase
MGNRRVRFGIGEKLGLASVALALLAVIAAGSGIYGQFAEVLEENQLDSLDAEARVVGTQLVDDLAMLIADTRFLGELPALHEMKRIAQHGDPVARAEFEAWRLLLQSVFQPLIQSRPMYSQIRLIGVADGGRELIRLERFGDRVEVAAELQRKGDQPYFQQSIALPPGEVLLSRIELNQQHGRIQEPHVPVIRASVPVHDAPGKPFGMIVINANARTLFAAMRQKSKHTLYVTDERGEFIAHPDETAAFAFEFGRSHRIQQTWPQVARVFETALAAHAISGDHAISLQRVHIDPARPERFVGVALVAPMRDVLADSITARGRALAVGAAVILVSLVFSWFASRSLIRPLERMTEAARAYGQGREDIALPLDARDEIGELAHSFHSMVERVKARTAELERALARAEQAEGSAAARAAELARSVEELKRSNRDLDEFAYVASHDLKAPLRAIDNLARFIDEDAVELLPEASRQHLTRMQQRVRRMEKLLEDLLDYSRAGRIGHQPEVVNVQRLVREAVELIAPPEKFDVRIASDLPELVAPRIPLEQIFRNLIGNAVKHHDRADGHIAIGWSDRGDSVEFSVADDGPGIAPEHHERVFRMFSTLKPRDDLEGSGMGLALIKKLLNAAGGSIRLESDGRGAIFRFAWPRSGAGSGARPGERGDA